MILFTSVWMRSAEMMLSRLALRRMEAKLPSSMRNPNWDANRTARSMRNGSSLYVTSGSKGVRIHFRFKSSTPPNGSTSLPNESALRLMAMALMVKSRRFWSSSNVPSSTTGFLLPRE